MKYEELIEKISQKELKKTLYYSQALFFTIALILSFTFFRGKINWGQLLTFNLRDLILYGLLLAIVIVVLELLLYHFLDEKHFDDGGLNEKLFKNLPIHQVFFIALIVAISEEVLFRGVIQSVFGYIVASTLFALMHYRYFKKIVLFSLLVLLSFLLGFLFELTNSLYVTIVFHFIVDFLLGLYIAKRVR